MKKFNHILSTLLLTTGAWWSLSGCEAGQTEVADKSQVPVVLNITMAAPATQSRTAGTGASDAPMVDHIQAFFFVDGMLAVSGERTLINNGATYERVPTNVNKIYVIGYPAATFTSPVIPGGIAREADLLKEMFDMTAQTTTDTKNVNSFGVTTVDLSQYPNGSTQQMSIEVRPAIARIEIGKIDPTATTASLTIRNKIKKFDLDCIYINNTYTQLGMNRITLPTANGTVLNYGGYAIDGSTPWGDPATYFGANYYDAVGGKGQASYSPGTSKYWGYYVAPLAATGGVGTTINDDQQTVLPHIILKLSNLVLDDGDKDDTNDVTVPGPMFLTIRRYNVKETSTEAAHELTEMQPGYVYVIDNIAFGLEHLSILPEQPATDYYVDLKVIDWVNVLVNGDVD
ncbi:MAG: hypothetical protein LBL97_05605 [Prevotellaceae bacterium]|jgi:hypothetical protein|nr:hypothetical protein [Prevotellaceae bacterium]